MDNQYIVSKLSKVKTFLRINHHLFEKQIKEDELDYLWKGHINNLIEIMEHLTDKEINN
jgi:hypothetical protein